LPGVSVVLEGTEALRGRFPLPPDSRLPLVTPLDGPK
jgi:hypothetical protein